MDYKNYVFNPRARLKFTIGTPVKTEGFKIFNYHKLGDEGFKNSVLAFRDTGLWDSLLSLIETPDKIPQIPQQHLEVFTKMGILLPEEHIAKPLLFQTKIQEDYPDLLPEYTSPELPTELELNSEITIQWQFDLPPTLQPYIFSQELLSHERPVIWVPHKITGVHFPYKVSAKLAKLLALNPLPEAIASLPLAIQTQLYWADILQIPHQQHAENSQELTQTLETQEFLILRKLIPPLQIGALRQYIRQLKAEGYFFLKEDKQVKLRDYIYNDPLMSFFHIQLTRYLNTFLPEQVQPSFTFLCYYNPGSILDRHTDREQCAWNVSLCVDMAPEYPLDHVWPIYIEANNKDHKVMLELGDAVLYRGTENDHWRNALPESDQVSMALFHFVNFDFSGDLT